MQKSRRLLALSIVITIFLVFGITIYRGKNAPTITEAFAAEISMMPTKHDSAGVDLDTEFVLTAKSSLDLGFIENHLTVDPSIDFTVKKDDADPNKIRVLPKELLEPQKIYKFGISAEGTAPLNWAFQTKGDFKVVSTLPRDQATEVPLNTGIEISFSHLNYDKLPDFFDISPRVKGTFEIHKKTAVFVPKSLEPETIYTVTIKKGLPLSGSSQVLEKDYTFQFETCGEVTHDYNLNFYKNTHEFTTNEKPLFQFSYYNWGGNVLPDELEFVVYKYQSADDYIESMVKRNKVPYWAYRNREKYQEDTSKLETVSKFSTTILESDYMNFIEFPEPMTAGYYVAETQFFDLKRQVWFQVTDLSLYAAVDKNNTYVWLNDLSKGVPVAGANIKIWGSNESTVSDNNGLAVLTTPEHTSSGVYAVISKDNRQAVAAISPWHHWEPRLEAQKEFAAGYWKYLYLDRSLYKPNDTVHFWGILKPRAEDVKAIDKVTIVISSGRMWNSPIIDSREVQLDGFNFTDSMKLLNLSPGYYNLEVKAGEYVIFTRGFEVQTYTKPAYSLEIEASKKAVYVGDKVDFQVKAEFFEQTPASYVPLSYYIQYYGNGNVATDEEGNANITYYPKFQEDQFSPFINQRLFLTAKLPESGEITNEASIMVLNNDISIEASDSLEENTAMMEINVDRLTVNRINSGEAEVWDQDAYKGDPAANHSVKYAIYKEVWEKRADGQYYDFINKKVETRYIYDYKKVLESEGQVTTNQEGKANFSFPVENMESYIVELTATDYHNNPYSREHRVFGPGFRRDFTHSWYYLDGKSSYKSNEDVKLSMKENEGLLLPRPKSFLFFVAQNGILEAYVQDSPDFSTTFKEELIPNFWVRGVYFDGRNYHDAYNFQVTFDKSEKELNIDIETDNIQYKPKDTVNVDIKVTDKKGNPVEALVNLNLVDEALYALQYHHTDILNDLYTATYDTGIKTTFFSHEVPLMPSDGAEQGGEGGSERKDFRDTVMFKTIVTDKQGKARVSFEVPDNLTSWRLTCQAVTKDLSAATKTAPIVVKLPFFVDMVVNDTYLTSDQPVIPIRAFGDKLKAGATVTYETALKSGDKTSRKTLSGKAFSMAQLPLSELENGHYELTVTGKTADGLTDTLTMEFNVVDSRMTKRQVDFWLLNEDLKLQGASDSLTYVTFTDYERSQYLNMLFRLQGVHGSRIEQKIAPETAKMLLEHYFSDMTFDYQDYKDLDLLKYQTPEGGIAILPYSDADLKLSAKIAALFSDAFDNNALADYFYKIAQDPNENRERSLIALCGLSALGEPVLTELKLLSEQEDLTVMEELYLSMAFLEIGDQPAAAQIIKTVIQESGEDLESQLRIDNGQDQDDILEATAMAAVVAAGTNVEEYNKLQAYLLENSTTDILLYIEQLLFLKRALPLLPEESVSFSYTIEGKQTNVQLKAKETLTLLLTPDKLSTIEFDNIKGRIGVTAVYNIVFDSNSESFSDEIKITRSYQVSGKNTQSFDSNDLIKINISYEFSPKAPDGPYFITDFLPSGLKIMERPYYHGEGDHNTSYPVEIDGSKVTFAVYEKKNRTLNYYARVVNPGAFKAESALMQHMKSGKIYNVTSTDMVDIK
ncbi:MAG: Ig-like domain-containing protein [Tepidanaerobacteraceae bacterium]